jgi:hypothetical protein
MKNMSMILNMDIYNEVCLCLRDLVDKTVELVEIVERNVVNDKEIIELNQLENCNIALLSNNDSQSKDMIFLFENLNIENEHFNLRNENLYISCDNNKKLSTIFRVDMFKLMNIAFFSVRLYNLREHQKLNYKKMPKLKRLNKVLVDKNLFHDVDKLSLIRVYDSFKLKIFSQFDLDKNLSIQQDAISKNICLNLIKKMNKKIENNQHEEEQESIEYNLITSAQKPNDDDLFLVPAIPPPNNLEVTKASKNMNFSQFEFSATQPFDLSIERLNEPFQENSQSWSTHRPNLDFDSSIERPKIDRKFLDFVSINYDSKTLNTPCSSEYILTQCGTVERIIHKKTQQTIDATSELTSKVVSKPVKKRHFLRVGLSKNLKVKKPLHSNLVHKK